MGALEVMAKYRRYIRSGEEALAGSWEHIGGVHH